MNKKLLQKRTWPYGTKKNVEVVDVAGSVLALIDDNEEGFLLMWPQVESAPAKGDRGMITFTEGGPTGGYWKYEASNTNDSRAFSA